MEETTKKTGVCVTGEEEGIFCFISSNKHWDKCSCFLCLTEKTGSGRLGPYNVQLTVVNNNCYESSVCVCARMALCVSGRARRASGSVCQFSVIN